MPDTGPVSPIPILLIYNGSLCEGEQCVVIHEMNHVQFSNSEHILMTTKFGGLECKYPSDHVSVNVCALNVL